MGKLTTNVLDTVRGKPGAGTSYCLLQVGGNREPMTESVTNADGGPESPASRGNGFSPAFGTLESGPPCKKR